jgi:hypothetical protein
MCKRYLAIICLCVILATVGGNSPAAIIVIKGDDRDFWQSCSLIVGVLKADSVEDTKTKVCTAHLDVAAVAWTDQVVPHEVTIQYEEGVTSAIWQFSLLSKGRVILACISKANGKWIVTNQGLAFMPQGAGIFLMNGENDPALEPLLEKIDMLRHAAMRGEHFLDQGATTTPSRK